MGALIAGIYADRYSRRHSIVIACGTFTSWGSFHRTTMTFYFFQSCFVLGQLFNVALCVLPTYSSVVPWVGQESVLSGESKKYPSLKELMLYIYPILISPGMLSPLYMAEISPPGVRGSLMTVEQLSIVLGVAFGFWTGFITRSSIFSTSYQTQSSLLTTFFLLLL